VEYSTPNTKIVKMRAVTQIAMMKMKTKNSAVEKI